MSHRPEVRDAKAHAGPWPAWAKLGQQGMLETARSLNVAVLYGGTSSEREVCLVSGRAMLAALEGAGESSPSSVTGVEITPDGQWTVGGEPMAPTQAINALPADTVFMIGLHGGEGEGGPIQGFLQLAGRAHTGTGVAASALCLDKIRSRQVFAQSGLRIAPGLEIWPQQMGADVGAQVERILALGPGPWFLKPSLGGSSVSMGHARNKDELRAYLASLPDLLLGEGILVEQAVPGVEVTVGMLAGSEGPATCLPVVEIQPRPGRWFDYEEKYSDGGAVEFCPPKNVSQADQLQVQEAARIAWDAVGLSGYARLDFILPEQGPPVLLEANTLPGFTPRSLFPMAAKVDGLSFESLCVELCLRAHLDHGISTKSGARS